MVEDGFEDDLKKCAALVFLVADNKAHWLEASGCQEEEEVEEGWVVRFLVEISN